jgi:hypothetical protein
MKTLIVVALLLVSPRALGAADAIDLAACVQVPDGVAAWPQTATITHLEVSPGGFHIDFDKKDSWPDVTPPGWDGPIRWTVWLGAIVNGRCHLAASLNVWNRDDSYGGPVTDPTQYPKNLWYLDSGLAGYTPQPGETIYLMLTAGAERGLVTMKVAERSQIVSFPLGAGSWSFSKPLPPAPPIVTPPVVTPPVVTPPAPLPEGVLLAKVDALTQLLQEHIRADGDAHASINQNVTDGRAENTSRWTIVTDHWKSITAVVTAISSTWYVTKRTVQP